MFLKPQASMDLQTSLTAGKKNSTTELPYKFQMLYRDTGVTPLWARGMPAWMGKMFCHLEETFDWTKLNTMEHKNNGTIEPSFHRVVQSGRFVQFRKDQAKKWEFFFFFLLVFLYFIYTKHWMLFKRRLRAGNRNTVASLMLSFFGKDLLQNGAKLGP